MNAKTRGQVYEKYGRRCAYCGRYILYKDMQVDHFHPKDKPYYDKAADDWKRAGDDFDNLMPSCRRCNHYKRASNLEYFRLNLLEMERKVLGTYLGKVAVDYGMVTWNGWDGKFYFEKCMESMNLNITEV